MDIEQLRMHFPNTKLKVLSPQLLKDHNDVRVMYEVEGEKIPIFISVNSGGSFDNFKGTLVIPEDAEVET